MSINANGLNQPTATFFDQVLRRYQMVALQETKFNNPDKLQSVEYFAHVADPTARCFWSHATTPLYNGRHGVGLMLATSSPFSDATDITSSIFSTTLTNRYLLVRAMLGGEPTYLHVVYAPDEEALRGEFFRALPLSLDPAAHHIVMGDFNVTMNDLLDQRIPGHHAGVGRDELRDWLLHYGLLDAWRLQHPDTREFTSPKDRNRIDFCFMSASLALAHLQDISHVIGPKFQHEDHKPVDVLLGSVAMQQLKSAPWRCPTWLLRDTETIKYLVDSADRLAGRFRKFNGANPGCLLDEHKRDDCKWLRERWQLLRQADTKEFLRLHQRVQDRIQQQEIRETPENAELLAAAKHDLKAYQDELETRRKSRKFAADLHDSERASKSFFTKPVPDGIRIPIPGVVLNDGTTSSDPVDVAHTHRQFWGGLFQSPSDDLRLRTTASYSPLDLSGLLSHTAKRVSSDHRKLLDAPLTANDFYWAITKSKKNKAPGPDGLPIEYYQLAPETWARIYEVVYDGQLERRRMTKFQRRAHLSLLYKAGSRYAPSNYRPLTLLNHDAKLGPKILAKRLGKVLSTLVHDDQSGFVPGRSIRHALLRFQDIQAHCKNHHDQAGAVMLDFEKAFDSVVWAALDMVLVHFGFGDTFRDWIKTFYSGTLVSVLVGDSPGRPFELGAGVRQGDPLSPGLFVVFIEPMLNYLRARMQHAGIKIGTSEPHVTLAFADDCTGLLHDLRDAPTFLDAVTTYARAAGMRLNKKKTTIMPFTTSISRTTVDALHTLGVKIVTGAETVKLLGVLQGATITSEQRFVPVLEQMRRRCVLWRYRARTLLGRSVILQSVILPLTWYTASVTIVPKSVLAAIDVIIRNFINNCSPSDTAAAGKMSMKWTHVDKVDGGLGLVVPSIFTHATHLTCLRDAVHHTAQHHRAPRWFEPALHSFDKSLNGLGRGFDIMYADIPRTRTRTSQWAALHEFWFETLLTWRRLQDNAGVPHLAAMAQVAPIWNNFWLVFGATKRPMFKLSRHNVSLITASYTRLQDFVDRHSNLPTHDIINTILTAYDDFERPASKTRFVNETMARLGVITSPLPLQGPTFPTHVEAAHHPWHLRLRDNFSKPFVLMSSTDFVHALGPATEIPSLPLEQLKATAVRQPRDLWRTNYKGNKHLLPVFADLKYRLQHNALGLRYKFKWRTQVDLPSTCVHGCVDDEDARHLFWTCSIAQHQWRWFTQPIRHLLQRRLTWEDALFGNSVVLTSDASKRYGNSNFNIVFNIIRGCVLRTTWLHRNDKMYNPSVRSSATFVQHHTSSYVRLHLAAITKYANDTNNTKLSDLVRSTLGVLDTRTEEDFVPTQQERQA